MRNVILTVLAVGVGAWLLLNYHEAILSPQSWTRWLRFITSRDALILALLLAPVLILWAWASFRSPKR